MTIFPCCCSSTSGLFHPPIYVYMEQSHPQFLSRCPFPRKMTVFLQPVRLACCQFRDLNLEAFQKRIQAHLLLYLYFAPPFQARWLQKGMSFLCLEFLVFEFGYSLLQKP